MITITMSMMMMRLRRHSPLYNAKSTYGFCGRYIVISHCYNALFSELYADGKERVHIMCMSQGLNFCPSFSLVNYLTFHGTHIVVSRHFF